MKMPEAVRERCPFHVPIIKNMKEAKARFH